MLNDEITPAEMKVLKLLPFYTMKGIGEKLGKNERTVNTQVASIACKYGWNPDSREGRGRMKFILSQALKRGDLP